MRVMALYLPQFHRTDFNDENWGVGYTEWTAVKKAKPMYKHHIQPKEPLDNNYYDLSDESGKVWQWQAELARNYGIYGFCIYHYWLGDGVQLLEKPMEILLKHPEIELKYCICWANHDWSKGWYGTDKVILAEQKYGNKEEWKQHFYYLLPFFSDERYIKIENKPVVNMFDTGAMIEFSKMKTLWDDLAKKAGFDGIYIISCLDATHKDERDAIDAYYYFEPGFTYYQKSTKLNLWIDFQLRKFRKKIGKLCWKGRYCPYRVNGNKVLKLLAKNNTCIYGKKAYLGVFAQWDNTPRKQEDGMVYENITPSNFGKALASISKRVSKEDFVYINAWNEWGEGCYLEPDKMNEYKYLEEIRKQVYKN